MSFLFVFHNLILPLLQIVVNIFRVQSYIKYNERIKANTMKYLKEHRESLRLNLPIGTKDVWKAYAADRGISVTELITRLITEDMEKHNWKNEPEQENETKAQTSQPEEPENENGA